ncbi:MAG: folate-binding protein YgfZ [Pseudolabrys sp.]
MKAAFLSDRGVVRVTGDDARHFLNNIVTADIENLAPGTARYAALLTPQGKIIVDFLVTTAADGSFYFDCPAGRAGTLAARLKFYKLRAKVTIEDLSDHLGIVAAWPGSAATEHETSYPDPRLAALGSRLIVPRETAKQAVADTGARPADAAAYHTHRVALGIPEGGLDFAYDETFPHEADMDQLGGIDFDKGCYIGQEVVSRVEHRGSARSRVVPATLDGPAPAPGTAVMAGDKQIGTLGSAADGRALALLRLDRVADAIEAATPMTAGGISVRPVRPDWSDFPWPGEATAQA